MSYLNCYTNVIIGGTQEHIIFSLVQKPFAITTIWQTKKMSLDRKVWLVKQSLWLMKIKKTFFKKWAIPSLFFFIFIFSIQLTVNKCFIYILPMTGLELWTSGIRSDRSTWATTTANVFVLEEYDELCIKLLLWYWCSFSKIKTSWMGCFIESAPAQKQGPYL